MTRISHEDADEGHGKRSDYVSCNLAFIDSKKPCSHLKENYSIIGRCVTWSGEQVINLPEAHGFNIGAAAVPHEITNNLHIHFTAERWTIVSGTLCTPVVFEPVLDLLGVDDARRIAVPVDTPSLAEFGNWLKDFVAPGDIVCGFSLGSLVLAHNLAALGDARAVVLLSLNPLSDSPGNAATRLAVRDRILSGDAVGWVHDNWHAMSTDTGTEVRDIVVAMAQETEKMVSAQIELAIHRPDAVDALTSTDLPLVFVTGAEDTMTPPGPIESVAARARRAAVRILPGLGHFALLESPDQVTSAIESGLIEVLEKSPL